MLRRPRYPLLGALIGVALLVVLHVLAFELAAGHRLDAATLGGFVGLKRPSTDGVALFVAGLAGPKPFVVFILALVGVALLRRRPRVAAAAGIAALAANGTTQLLKPALAVPRVSSYAVVQQLSAASWPSGHATAAMTLALAAILVASPRRRPLVAALGAAFAVAVSYAFLSLGWHYPSDVLGGFLVAATWMLIAVAAVLAADRRWPARPTSTRARTPVRQALVPVAGLLVAGLALALLVALARPEAVLSYARDHRSFVVGAAAIGALALSLAAGLAVALRR